MFNAFVSSVDPPRRRVEKGVAAPPAVELSRQPYPSVGRERTVDSADHGEGKHGQKGACVYGVPYIFVRVTDPYCDSLERGVQCRCDDERVGVPHAYWSV